MRTIRPHTREERLALVERITPRIRQRFGARLRALATCASVARGDDGPYSDLELLAILRDGPKGGSGVLHHGLLIELEWMTEADYVASCREVTGDWFLAGSSRLAPVLNPELIASLNSRVTSDLEAKCREQARRQWFEVQESTAKLLNAVHASDRDALGLVAWDAVRHLLIALALLNATPFTTFARMITQARTFTTRPESLGDLLDLLVQGRFTGAERLRDRVVSVYEEMETLFDSKGVPLGIGGLEALV